jgi:hypothetical protein
MQFWKERWRKRSLARSASNFRVIKANKRESTDDQGIHLL